MPYYHFLNKDTKSNTHPAIKPRPPRGVTAPSHFIPVIAKIYRLPENKTIPTDSKMADHLSNFEGKEIAITPISISPSA